MATQNEKILAGALIATIILAAIVVTLMLTRPISNVGKIRAIGFDVFADSACTIQLTQINWGTLAPGEMGTVTFFAKNSGNVNVTLNFNTTDWIPTNAPIYLVVAWNYTGQLMKPLDVIPIATTLAVSTTITGITNFSYTMNVNAVEVKP